MNILPKKSWHVRTRKNIERVRRDEAEAERLAKLEQDRILQVEQELRAQNYRARQGIVEPQRHFNLFEPSLVSSLATNKDHEEEKQREQANWEQKVGISKKLVRTEDVNQPWYCQPKNNLTNHNFVRSKSDSVMSMYDPMTTIKHAEEIARAKKVKREEQEKIAKMAKEKFLMYHKQNLNLASTSSGARQSHSDKDELHARQSHPDSSPECIKIIKSKDSKIRGSKSMPDHRRKAKKEKDYSDKSSLRRDKQCRDRKRHKTHDR